ncbi:MAG: phosphate ABC transporter ATP-binding protein [Chloroflexi bacterium]|nr:MAG: phosphate ABC transporter ATP-binding protein [Chloroflexota bacterium]MBL1196433.1 phosphate ABC transporter ATP-binding protein [Chloroflexota bacterium]NOH13728.1 phosphate ABC transporter ATP-binding protein [Chloroflexota bacterium]
MGQAIYALENVQQNYDGRCVLDIESLSVMQGEVLAIVGPSGAGKSTLLRLLNFLEAPFSGSLTFDGETASAEMDIEQRRRVTMVFQHPVMLKRSLDANLHFGFALRGEKLSEELRAEWLQRLGLMGLRTQAANKLSAGEMQRVALARALIVEPDVLLLDEPTANLDPANVALMEKIVREENEKNHTTIVLVTHNVFQARRLAQRTALLIDGKLIEITDTEQFFEQPETEQTAAFVRGEFIY